MGTTALIPVVIIMRSINMIQNSENFATLTLEIEVPMREKKSLTEEEVREIQERAKARLKDILGSFAPRIIASLKRRMKACLTHMLNHAENMYTPCEGIIQWDQKNGSHNHFSIYSYNEMLNCIKAFNNGCLDDIMKNAFWMDQILKALLLDPVEFQDHTDAGGFRYSELISLLCECHVFGQR